MDTIKINSSHIGSLSQSDIDKIKKADDGDTIKFGRVFGKEYTVVNDGESISLKQKESKSFFNNFFGSVDSGKNSDLKLNAMNQQLKQNDLKQDLKVLTVTYNQANQSMPQDTKNYFQNLINNGDYDVVLFAEQESKLLANDLELDGMNMISQNKMKVMTKGLKEGISYTSMTVFAKDDVNIKVNKESEYRHGWNDSDMDFFFGLTGNKGGVKTSLEINGQEVLAVSAHLDSNDEAKRELEGDKLLSRVKPNEEVVFTGDLNEREKLLENGTMYDPVSTNDTHLAKHGLHFQPLDTHTYLQEDKDGNIKQKKGRERPDFGELDNTGVTNKTGNIQNLQTQVIDDGFENVSDHKPVMSTFDVKAPLYKPQTSELDVKSMKYVNVEQTLSRTTFAISRGVEGFQNGAKMLSPQTVFTDDLTLSDILDTNRQRLALEGLNEFALEVVKDNFADYVMVRDAIFSHVQDSTTSAQSQVASLPKNERERLVSEMKMLTQYVIDVCMQEFFATHTVNNNVELDDSSSISSDSVDFDQSEQLDNELNVLGNKQRSDSLDTVESFQQQLMDEIQERNMDEFKKQMRINPDLV